VNKLLHHMLGAGAILAAGALLGGCVVEEGVGRPVVVADLPAYEVDAVPVAIETYPQAYYRGSVAYYVDGRWFYRTPTGFVVFRREPVELARYRTQVRTTARVHVR
jgi:hypothetical protein